jgi:RNA polymerase sigma factor (sigma-70 family)
MSDSLWFTTRSALFEPGDAAWDEVARYDAPLRRLLALRYGRALSHERREDLTQEILIEIKESLRGKFEGSRGRFRALLQVVVKRRVIDELRRAKPEAIPDSVSEGLTAPSEDRLEALDLEAALVRAVESCRDTFTSGPRKDHEVLHALTDRLVHGLRDVEIARREGISRDRVGRRLAKAREVIFADLLAFELGLEAGSSQVTTCVDMFKRCLRKPVDAQRHMETLADSELREGFQEFWQRFRAALPHFRGDESVAGRELAHGVTLILGEDQDP